MHILSASAAIMSVQQASVTNGGSGAGSNDVNPFPEEGILPKKETQAASFLSKYPEYDGRGVVVAVFDTGCDPGASGLSGCTSVSPSHHKYVDFIDATGSGDVSTSTRIEAQPAADGTGTSFVSPLSNRALRIPGSVKNPRGVWQVGMKRAYELYPNPLVDRMKKERRKLFDEKQRALEQQLAAKIAVLEEELKKEKEKKDGDKSSSSGANGASSSSSPSSSSSSSNYPTHLSLKEQLAELEGRLECVRLAGKNYDDPGPVFDVVCWHEGQPASEDVGDNERERESGWWVMVDSTGTGDFTDAKPLTHYYQQKEFATFSGVDLMNYTVNIYSQGQVVSIVTTAGSHGTHVAGIIGAYEKDESAQCGIAPGCQIVSIKIGDSRLGSMETGTGLIRGIIEAIRLKVDIINMSYGEASSIPNSGRISDWIKSAVFDHGILFVSSAGNNGPALTTTGSPGSTDEGVIGVGAYVSGNMSLACYSSRQAVRENQYTWSSRGPSADGALGVCISACGGAITSVCQWQLQRHQLMNGTSMSSPAAAGGLALILSGLKARGIKYTPHRIRHAIENTAREIAHIEKLAIGHGLLQIERAFEHLVAHAHRPELDLFYRASLPSHGRARGIYLRDSNETNRAFETQLSIEPCFREQKIDEELEVADGTQERKEASGQASPFAVPVGIAHAANYALNLQKSSFEKRIRLVVSPSSSAQWIECPSHLVLLHNGRAFTVVVHAEKLKAGSYHFAEILGYDADAEENGASASSNTPALGPLFRVPVTVTKPEDPEVAHSQLVASHVQDGGSGDSLARPGTSYSFRNLPYEHGCVHRRFIRIPEGASYADFTIKAHSFTPKETAAHTGRSFMFHALYLQAETPYRDHECDSFFSLNSQNPTKMLRMDVRPGLTLEVCLAQYWSSIGACVAGVEVEFHGVEVENRDEIVLDASEGFHAVHFRNVLRTTKLSPTASLKVWNSPLKPSSSVIAPLSRERDLLPRGGRLVSALTLTYHFELKEDSSCVRVRAPPLNGRLYESIYESQLTMIFDQFKKFYFATDAFESGKPLKAGKYIAKVQVRHDDVCLLEKLKDMTVVVETNLSKSIDLPIYSSYTHAANGGAKFGSNKLIKPGRASILYLGVPDAKAFPSHAKPGDWASGQLVVCKPEPSTSNEKGGAVKLRLYAPAAPAPPAPAPPSVPLSATHTHTEAAKKEKQPFPEPEQDPALPKEEQKEPTRSPPPAGAEATSSGPATSAPQSPTAAGEQPTCQPTSLQTELRDVTIEHVRKLKDSDVEKKTEALNTILPPLLAQFPSHLPLLALELHLLHSINRSRPHSQRDDSAVLTKADRLLNEHIDQQALLATFGKIIDKDDAAQVAQRKEKEDVRKILLQTLTIKMDMAIDRLKSFKRVMNEVEYQASVRKEIMDADSSDENTDATRDSPAFQSAFSELKSLLSEAGSWIDLQGKEGKKLFAPYQHFLLKLQRQYGVILKQLQAEASTLASDASALRRVGQERVELLTFLAQKELSYSHLVQHEQNANLVQYAPEFLPF